MGKKKIDLLAGILNLMILKTLDTLGTLHGYGVARRIEQISGNLLQFFFKSSIGINSSIIKKHLILIFSLMLLVSIEGVNIVEGANIKAQKSLKKEIEKEILEMKDVYNVPGLSVAIVKDNEIILSRGFGLSNIEKRIPFDENTAGRLASATKFFTGLAFLKMAEKGVIDLNAPLKTYLTHIPADWRSIPLWRLMNHTSGIPTTENTPFEKMTDDEQRKISERNLFEMFNKSSLDYIPGEKWRYQQTGFVILSMIIAEKTGHSWQQILQQNIFEPAKMINTSHNDLTKYPTDLVPKNYEFKEGKFINSPFFFPVVMSTGAGYNSTAADMAKLFLALNNEQILPLKFLKDEVFVKERMYPLRNNASYSISSEIKSFGKFLTIGHSGGPDIANIRYSADGKLGVAVLANRNTTGISEDLTNRIFNRILLGVPFDKQQKSIVYSVKKILAKSSYEKIMAFFDQAKLNKQIYDFTEVETGFNALGYVLLNENRIDDAVKIFRLNVREFPSSANAYDSLAEAYEDAGNSNSAIKNYRRSLELNPKNTNAVEHLRKLDPNYK